MLRGGGHDVEHLVDEVTRDTGVKQVVPSGSVRCLALSYRGALEVVRDMFWSGVVDRLDL